MDADRPTSDDVIDPETGCWIWWKATTPAGLSRRWPDGNAPSRTVSPAPVSWELQHGPLPPGTRLRSRCDERRCVCPDPEHRIPVDNGEITRHLSAKLSWPVVRQIRALHAEGVRTADLARQFGVGLVAIQRVISGTTWRE